MADCSSCHKPLVWCISEAGKPMPVDRASKGKAGDAPEGRNLAVWVDPGGDKWHCRVITADQPLRDHEAPAMAHWATCPRARAHRGVSR